MGGSEPALGILLASLIWLLPAFAVLWIFLRHAPLALLIALVPLPGLLIEQVLRVEIITAYAFSFCVGLLMAGALLRRQLSGNGDWRGVAWAGAGAAIVAASFYWEGALILLFGGLSAGGLTMAAFRWFRVDEAFVARANRAAEARARILEAAAHIVVPRWALAVCGIGAVMAVLAWFEVPPQDVPNYPALLVLSVVTFLLARDWRAAVAAGLCAVLLWLFGAGTELSFFALPALLLTATAHAQKPEGEGAWRRALEEEGAGLLFAGLGVFLLLVSYVPVGAAPVAFAAQLSFAMALILFLALAVTLSIVFPRHRSVEEMYRS